MVKVTVPATSANLGAGFDTCGLALQLYNTASMEENDVLDISSADGSFAPQGPGNLIYRTAQQLYEVCGKKLSGLTLVQTNDIPMARGLGSSSACIAAGLLGANRLLGEPVPRDELLKMAVKTEGHPDNVAPAMLGGFVSSVYDGDALYTLGHPIGEELVFAAFIPSFKLLTEKARAALPAQVSRADAVYNVSRAALLTAAFCMQQYDLLGVATRDRLHQPYRLPLIEGGAAVLALAEECGALGCFISGAGPTLLAVVRAGDTAFFEKAEAMLRNDSLFAPYTLHRFAADNNGAYVED